MVEQAQELSAPVKARPKSEQDKPLQEHGQQEVNRESGDRSIEEVLREREREREIRFGDNLDPEQRQHLEGIVCHNVRAFGYANATPADIPTLRTYLKPDYHVVTQMPARLTMQKRKVVHDLDSGNGSCWIVRVSR